MLEEDEGEVTIYYYYEDYEKLFEAVEKYTGIRMANWENCTQKGCYPDLHEIDLGNSWEKFKVDFSNKILSLPSDYKDYLVRGMYWKALDSGEIRANDPIDVFRKWLRRKMEEEE